MNKSFQIPQIPLSERIRPTSLESFFGQDKLVGKGKGPSKQTAQQVAAEDALKRVDFKKKDYK